MNEEERMVDEQKAVEALEELEKQHEVTYEMLIDYIKPPIFTEEIKQRIFDIVREDPPKCTKKQIKTLFNPNAYKYLATDDLDILMVMISMDKCGNYSYWDRFVSDYSSLVSGAFAEANPLVAYNELFADAYTDCQGDFAIESEWLNERITMDEWEALFLEMADEDETIVDEITESPG